MVLFIKGELKAQQEDRSPVAVQPEDEKMIAVSVPPMNSESQINEAVKATTMPIAKRRANQRELEERKKTEEEENRTDSEYIEDQEPNSEVDGADS